MDEPKIINVPQLVYENIMVSSDEEMVDVNSDNVTKGDEMQEENSHLKGDAEV